MRIGNSATYDFKYYWGKLVFFQSEIDLNFEAIYSLTKNTEETFNQLKEKFKSKIIEDKYLNRQPNSIDDEIDQDQYYDHYYSWSEEILDQMYSNLRKSIVLSIYSMIEGKMKRLCEIIEEKYDLSVKLNDLNGTDLIKSWKYLTKVFGVDSKNIEPYFTVINQHKFVRNKIAHNDSVIDTKDIKKCRAKGLTMWPLVKDYELKITDICYIEYLLNNGEKLFSELLKGIDRQYQIRRSINSRQKNQN